MAGRRRVLAREWLLALVEIAFDFGRVAGTALGDGPGAAHAGVQLIAGLEGEHHVLGPFGEPHAATSLVAPGVHCDGGGLVAFVGGGGPEHGAVRGFIYFSDFVINSVLTWSEITPPRSPSEWGNILRQVNTFTNAMLLSIIEYYQED